MGARGYAALEGRPVPSMWLLSLASKKVYKFMFGPFRIVAQRTDLYLTWK